MAIFVIRAGFEPTTHSLEGCCSIQLSYRTRPLFCFRSAGQISKVGAKIVIIFGFAIKCLGQVFFIGFESTEIALFVLLKSEMEESDRVSGLFVG